MTDDTSLIRLTSKKIEEVKDSKKEESKTTGIRPEFKEALDSYEQFFNEYADLMEAYKNNPTDLQLLTKYADFMSKYSDYMQKLDELKTEDMSTEESAYFIDVTMIPKSGPLFHYEEVKGIQEVTSDDESTYYNSKDYDPMIGLIPGINFDPDTGEIFDDTLIDDD